MKTAKKILEKVSGSGAKQHLYELSEPLTSYDGAEQYKYVIVSAVTVPYSGPETYIFGADEYGNVLDFFELPGSFRGSLHHKEALKNAGYKVE